MTDYNMLNRWLAVHVLGWQIHHRNTAHWVASNWEEKYVVMACVSEWNPCERFADCEALLNKIEKDEWRWSWIKLDTLYACILHAKDGTSPYRETASTRTLALCRAVGKASGWKERDEEA